MSSDEFGLFCTYLYLSGNKRVKSILSIFLVFLMTSRIDLGWLPSGTRWHMLLRDHNRLPPPQHNAGSSSGSFKNPFFNNEQSSITAAVTLLGHPGIGMQCDVRRNCDFSSCPPQAKPWLLVVLVLRILAGQPTIYHHKPKICYVFNGDGLYEVNFRDAGIHSSGRRQFSRPISSQYWCLVYCNRAVQDVPDFLATLRAFIVQSVPPRDDRLKSWRKTYDHFLSSLWGD
jgi:hypothetical protein